MIKKAIFLGLGILNSSRKYGVVQLIPTIRYIPVENQKSLG